MAFLAASPFTLAYRVDTSSYCKKKLTTEYKKKEAQRKARDNSLYPRRKTLVFSVVNISFPKSNIEMNIKRCGHTIGQTCGSHTCTILSQLSKLNVFPTFI